MRRILVGYDGSPAAKHALDRASELAKQYACPLMVLTAAVNGLFGDGVLTLELDRQNGLATAEQGAQRARRQGVGEVEARISLEGPAEALVAAARDGYDLVVVGHRGQGTLKDLFLGSTAKAVVDRAPCSVLVVR